MTITLTEQAAREVRKILTEQPPGAGRLLRIGIKGGGCGGFTYLVDLCSKPDPGDKMIETHGIKILCDPVSSLYLDGTVIDFSEDHLKQGFVFKNPNAKKNCTCGVSFEI
jgi:iron-sulfur cluster assembly protein